jgi:hypothetical protein
MDLAVDVGGYEMGVVSVWWFSSDGSACAVGVWVQRVRLYDVEW